MKENLGETGLSEVVLVRLVRSGTLSAKSCRSRENVAAHTMNAQLSLDGIPGNSFSPSVWFQFPACDIKVDVAPNPDDVVIGAAEVLKVDLCLIDARVRQQPTNFREGRTTKAPPSRAGHDDPGCSLGLQTGGNVTTPERPPESVSGLRP